MEQVEDWFADRAVCPSLPRLPAGTLGEASAVVGLALAGRTPRRAARDVTARAQRTYWSLAARN
jgi:hypothetical protein